MRKCWMRGDGGRGWGTMLLGIDKTTKLLESTTRTVKNLDIEIFIALNITCDAPYYGHNDTPLGYFGALSWNKLFSDIK